MGLPTAIQAWTLYKCANKKSQLYDAHRTILVHFTLKLSHQSCAICIQPWIITPIENNPYYLPEWFWFYSVETVARGLATRVVRCPGCPSPATGDDEELWHLVAS
jgi:hypothetical protein